MGMLQLCSIPILLFYIKKMRIYAKIFCRNRKKLYLCRGKLRIYAEIFRNV